MPTRSGSSAVVISGTTPNFNHIHRLSVYNACQLVATNTVDIVSILTGDSTRIENSVLLTPATVKPRYGISIVAGVTGSSVRDGLSGGGNWASGAYNDANGPARQTNTVRNFRGFANSAPTIAVPATTGGVSAVAFDRYFYITNGTAAITVAVSSGPSVVVPASGFATVFCPAGATLTYTYASGAPTQVVHAFGN
jgi:hypothetical protein